MSTQQSHITYFREMHKKGDPIILFNVWDAGSAQTVHKAGAKAIATGSLPVALAQGFDDGEQIPLDMAIANIERIIAAVDVPVSMDLESGYGEHTSVIDTTIRKAVATGIVGFNFEDQIIGGTGIYDVNTQVKRVDAARKAADSIGVSPFLNARTDIFLKAKPEDHTDAMLDDAIARAAAYADVGADGFFAPGLADKKLIGRLCEEVKLPVNIIALPHVPPKADLIELGVARISYGPVPYRWMMKSLGESAVEAFG